MANTDHTIGMMDGAYFTGRKEILEWINDTLEIGITKIEQTCTGAIACQLLDAHFPGNVQMNKLNWEAKSDHEYTTNYKILQTAFNKLNIAKTMELERLTRGKYQDNLEFMQWFKGFCTKHSVEEGYDPSKARSKGKGAKKVPDLFGKPGVDITTTKARRHASSGALGDSQREKRASSVASRASTDSVIHEDKENGETSSASAAASSAAPLASNTRSNTTAQSASSGGVSASLKAGNNTTTAAVTEALKLKLKEAELKQSGLSLHIEGVEKERTFYFSKLQEIEALLQTKEEEGAFSDKAQPQSQLAQQLFAILYAATDEFVAVSEEEENAAPTPVPPAGTEVVA